MDDSNQAKAATPHTDLIAAIMDSRVPKNEREWAASREIEALRAENERLRAACAAKDEAICTLRDHITVGMYRAVPHLADVAADGLSTDAGKGWIDATGAVETVVQEHDEGGVVAYGVIAPVPDSWSGRTVLVMVKP